MESSEPARVCRPPRASLPRLSVSRGSPALPRLSASDSLVRHKTLSHDLSESEAFVGDAPVLPLIRRHFLREGVLSEQCATRILREARALLRAEPNVVPLSCRDTPVAVVGDIHGQFYDLLSLMSYEDLPGEDSSIVFLGDYVDRGQFGTETVLYLCACKIAYPKNVILLRGNHESRPMCERDGFQAECLAKYSSRIFDMFIDLFCTMPLACLLLETHTGDCLCVHGGIGPDVKTVEDIDKVDRFMDVPDEGIMTDLLWADPLPEGPDDHDDEVSQVTVLLTPEQQRTTEFTPNTDRHTSWFFGMPAVMSFLQRNQLSCIIRGHQVQQRGFKSHFNEGSMSPRVLTLFSAPKYWDAYPNIGAFLRVSSNCGFVVQQVNAVEHPYVPPEFENIFTFSFPCIMDTVAQLLKYLAKEIREEDKDLPLSESIFDDMLAYKVRKLAEKSAKLKPIISEMLEVPDTENWMRFSELVARDKEKESRPFVRPRRGSTPMSITISSPI